MGSEPRTKSTKYTVTIFCLLLWVWGQSILQLKRKLFIGVKASHHTTSLKKHTKSKLCSLFFSLGTEHTPINFNYRGNFSLGSKPHLFTGVRASYYPPTIPRYLSINAATISASDISVLNLYNFITAVSRALWAFNNLDVSSDSTP